MKMAIHTRMFLILMKDICGTLMEIIFNDKNII
jgi:hypothetical protein